MKGELIHLADEKRYYWLKLKRDFFKRQDIMIIEAAPNGKDYVLFYLKLLCESVDHEGNLRFSDEIPYDEDMLATITNTNVDIVRSATKLFIKLGMMEVLDDGTLYMREVERLVGKESVWAEKKRVQRNAAKKRDALGQNEDIVLSIEDKKRTLSRHCPTEKEKEKEKDIEREKEKEKKKDPKPDSFVSVFEEFFISDRLKAAIMDFIDYRESIGIPTNASSLRALIKKLNELSGPEDEALAILEQSIANGWKGLFELKNKGKKPKTGGNGTGNFGSYEQRQFDYTDVEKKIRGYGE